jgi:TonB family protein
MSFADFQKATGRSSTPAAAATGPARTGPPPQVDIKGTLNDLKKYGEGGSNGIAGGPAQQSLMDAYKARLQARLDAVFENPNGVSDALKANVTIAIAADGRVTSARITNSSGNAVFDAAVRAALAEITNAGPTPNGQPVTFTVNFQRKT